METEQQTRDLIAAINMLPRYDLVPPWHGWRAEAAVIVFALLTPYVAYLWASRPCLARCWPACSMPSTLTFPLPSRTNDRSDSKP